MDIRPTGESLPPSTRSPQGPRARVSANPNPKDPGRDTYASSHRPGDGPSAGGPFWLVQMAADRLAGRQYLADGDSRRAERLESDWLHRLARELAPAVSRWASDHDDLRRLATHQALADAVCEGADVARTPLVVWQPDMTRGARGQFLFRVERGLVQLSGPGAGRHIDWARTVAHETFHHMQQELVSALYQGQTPEDPAFALLAAYYRDARARYKPLGPTCPPEAHRRQALERGAWAFGGAIAEHVASFGSHGAQRE